MSPDVSMVMSSLDAPHEADDTVDRSGSQQSELHQRQRMLIGMAQTIAKHGYRGATITEVVRHAHVSKRTFYEEFTDKESCFLELYAQTSSTLEQLIIERTDVNGQWREQIRNGARAYYTALTVEPLLTRAFFIEIATLSERATTRRREAFDRFAMVLVELVERARVANPDVPSRALTPMMASAILGGMTDVMIGAIEKDQLVERLDEIVDTCSDLIATMVTGQFHAEPA